MIATTLTVVFLCLAGCKDKKARTNNTSQKPEKVILETNNYFTTKVFGNQGPLVYVLSWVHDAGEGLRNSEDELGILLRNKTYKKALIAVEGEQSGVLIDYVDQWNRLSRSILQFAKQQGAEIYGGDDMNMNKYGRGALGVIFREAKMMTDDETCSMFYGIFIINRKRTEVLLKTLRRFKKGNPYATVIGMMGADHFSLVDHDILEKFATKNRMRIVLHYTTDTAKRKRPKSWPQKHCGDMKKFKGTFEKTIKRMAKGG